MTDIFITFSNKSMFRFFDIIFTSLIFTTFKFVYDNTLFMTLVWGGFSELSK